MIKGELQEREGERAGEVGVEVRSSRQPKTSSQAASKSEHWPRKWDHVISKA